MRIIVVTDGPGRPSSAQRRVPSVAQLDSEGLVRLIYRVVGDRHMNLLRRCTIRREGQCALRKRVVRAIGSRADLRRVIYRHLVADRMAQRYRENHVPVALCRTHIRYRQRWLTVLVPCECTKLVFVQGRNASSFVSHFNDSIASLAGTYPKRLMGGAAPGQIKEIRTLTGFLNSI